MTIDPLQQRIVEQLGRGQLVLWVGADLPHKVTGLPARADLALGLAHRHSLDESLSLAQVAQRVARGGNRFDFTSYLREQLDTTGRAAQPFHHRLVEIVREHGLRTIIVTAYDNLLELALREAGMAVNRIVRGSDVSFATPQRPTLIYLYGDAQQPETLVVTEDDHMALRRDREKEDVLNKVRSALRENTVLFLGYNLSDPDWQFLWREVLESAGQFALGAYAVWPGLPAGEAATWRDRGITILENDPLSVLGEGGAPTAPVSGKDRRVSAPSANAPQTRALDVARRALEILETQAAAYTALTIPAHLQIELEEKRRQVAELEGQNPAASPPTPPWDVSTCERQD